MRDYGKVHTTFWTDCFGNTWPVIRSVRRLKYKYPLHAAIRKHVFHTDNYQCRRCGDKAIHIPDDWDGKETLFTETVLKGYKVMLVVDHILTLKAGGKNEAQNFQTLCETCNRKKLKEDLVNIRKHIEAIGYGAR
jgi:5-methylcytosine-specific restriction endonuclease McrA